MIMSNLGDKTEFERARDRLIGEIAEVILPLTRSRRVPVAHLPLVL